MRNYCPWVTFSGFKVITVHIKISGFLCIFILVNNTVLGYITWNFYWSYKHYRVTSREVHFIFEYPKFRTKVQTDLWAIKNNSLLKYFEIKLLDAVHLDAGGGMFPPCGLLRLSLHRHRGQVSPLQPQWPQNISVMNYFSYLTSGTSTRPTLRLQQQGPI